MKPHLHPLSVLAGLALAGLLVVAASAAQRQPAIARHVPPDVHVCGQIPAEWWTYVRVGDAIPAVYTVPSDRHFVVTDTFISNSDLLANGASCASQLLPVRLGTESHGTRAVFQPGTVLTASSVAEVWGYLEPVR